MDIEIKESEVKQSETSQAEEPSQVEEPKQTEEIVERVVEKIVEKEIEQPDEFGLLNNQREAIKNAWNVASRTKSVPPSLMELVEAAYPNQGFDGRSKPGVKKFLASLGLKGKSSFTYIPKTAGWELSIEQKEYINNHWKTDTIVEMIRELFNAPQINNLSKEYRVVQKYLRALPEYQPIEEELAPYHPPHTLETAVQRIEEYVYNAKIDIKKNIKQKNEAQALLGYLNSLRFSSTINLFKTEYNRRVFESEFISCTYDKADLTAEQLSGYVNLALNVVSANEKRIYIDILNKKMSEVVNDPDGKISMGLAQAIHDAEMELDQNQRRQKELRKELQGQRSDWLKDQIRENASILNLVNLWKNEEERQKMLKYADLLKENIKKTVDEFKMNDLIAKIEGQSENEALQG